MTNIKFAPTSDFLQRSAATSPIKAVAELIWNGLDAGANKIEVTIITNALSGIDEIRVADDGSGINHDDAEHLFGSLGDSWKKGARRKFNRALHGKNGQGRIKGFALGNTVKWSTYYKDKDGINSFSIKGNNQKLTSLSCSTPTSTQYTTTGTVVTISSIEKDHGSLMNGSAPLSLSKIFGYIRVSQ